MLRSGKTEAEMEEILDFGALAGVLYISPLPGISQTPDPGIDYGRGARGVGTHPQAPTVFFVFFMTLKPRVE